MATENEDLSSLIKNRINTFQSVSEFEEIGKVTYIGDGIARAKGLENVMSGELLEFSNGSIGMAQNLEMTDVGIIILELMKISMRAISSNVQAKSWKYRSVML